MVDSPLIDPTQPSSMLNLHPKRQHLIDRRFEDWLPWITMAGVDPQRARITHERRLSDCLGRQFVMATIRRNNLDDPLLDEDMWQARMHRHQQKVFRRKPYGANRKES